MIAPTFIIALSINKILQRHLQPFDAVGGSFNPAAQIPHMPMLLVLPLIGKREHVVRCWRSDTLAVGFRIRAKPLHKIVSHGILCIVTSAQAKIPKTATAAKGSMKAFIISGVMLTFSDFINTFCGCVNWRRKAAVDVVGPFIAFGADHILHENSRIQH
jgi:hypothetical protein